MVNSVTKNVDSLFAALLRWIRRLRLDDVVLVGNALQAKEVVAMKPEI
jgi:hypothetical protein